MNCRLADSNIRLLIFTHMHFARTNIKGKILKFVLLWNNPMMETIETELGTIGK